MKTKGKRIIAAALASLMMFSLVSCANKEDQDDGCIYGKISSVDGNDIVIQLAEYSESTDTEAESDTDSKPEDDTSRSGKSGKRSRPQNGEMPEGFDPSQFGNLPEGFDGSLPDDFDPEQFRGRGSDNSDGSSRSSRRQMPENFDPEQFDGSLPEGFDPSQFGNMPEGFDPEQFDGSLTEDFDPSQFGGRMPGGRSGGGSKTISGESGSYTLTGEQKELRIPVGVTVTTSSGVKTGFDALKSGDIIKVKTEKDSDGNEVVTEVWIMEQ
ncbi:MAG: hypothetical protein IKP47_02480 [Ruminococcus sp.]|nr:hypothetical protein [Ruminococcus sp.]